MGDFESSVRPDVEQHNPPERAPEPDIHLPESGGKRPASHRCAACNIKVDDSEDDERHVCVPDAAGTVEYAGQRWRPTTAREAHSRRVERERGRGR